jgi:hypothetical protein
MTREATSRDLLLASGAIRTPSETTHIIDVTRPPANRRERRVIARILRRSAKQPK